MSLKSSSTLLFVLLFAFLIGIGTTAAQEATITLMPLDSQGYGLRLSPDGSRFAVFEMGVIHGDEVDSAYLPIRLYDTASQTLLYSLSASTDYAVDAAFSTDGKRLVSYHGDAYLYVWDAEAGTLIKRIPMVNGLNTLQFMPDNRTVALMQSALPTLLLLDTETGAITSVMTQHYPDIGQLRASFAQKIAFSILGLSASPDGTTLATATSYDDIWFWNVADGSYRPLVASEETKPMLGLRSLQYSVDGSLFGFADTTAGQIRIFDLQSGQEAHNLPAVDIRVFALAPDSQSAAWVDKGGMLHLVDLTAPDTTRDVALNLPESIHLVVSVSTLKYTSDGQKLILGGLVNTSGENAVAIINL
jgi:WD40 repeat protein